MALTGTFTGTGQSGTFTVRGDFNISLSGMASNTVTLQRSFDNGGTWKTLTGGSWTADADLSWFEPEAGVIYRYNCTVYGGSAITYRMSS